VFVGDTTLVQSIWTTLCSPTVRAVVRFGVPEHAEGRDRRAWALAARDEVQRLREAPLDQA